MNSPLITRRSFVKGFLAAAVLSTTPLSSIIPYNPTESDLFDIFSEKLPITQKFADVGMLNNGVENLIFKGVPVTRRRVKGSIWYSGKLPEFMRYIDE